MTNRPRNPQPDPSPASEEPRGDQAQKPAAPGVSFYPSAMNKSARKKFARARKVQGLNDEIALLRLRLRDLLAKKYPHKHQSADQPADQVPNKPSDPALDRTIDRTIEVIVRAYGARTRTSKNSPEDAAEGVATLFKDIAQELGMDLIPGKTNA